MADRPDSINAAGRLSFPTFTAEGAYESAHRAGSKLKPNQRPKTPADAKASFSLILSGTEQERLIEHVLTQVLPYFRQNPGDLDDAELDEVEDFLKKDIHNAGSCFKAVADKTLELVPSAASSLMVKAYRPGTDIKQEAFVTEESQLVSKPFSKKAIFPIEDTTLEMYPGAGVKATVSFWISSVNGNVYLSCNASAAVLFRELPSFVGGGSDSSMGDDDGDFID